MSNLTYNGQQISQRADGYVNATQMAKATGKLVANWRRNASTEAYIQVVSTSMRISIDELVIVKEGGNGGGTWIHPKLAIEFGRWVSPEFAYWCDEHIKTLMETGQTTIKPMTPLELAKEQVRLHEQLELQAAQIKILEEETERQAEVIDELFDYSSIVRVAKYNKISEKQFNWRQLKAASSVKGIEVKVAPCPRFVTKNLYHHDVWRLAYPGVNLPETTTLTISNN